MNTEEQFKKRQFQKVTYKFYINSIEYEKDITNFKNSK